MQVTLYGPPEMWDLLTDEDLMRFAGLLDDETDTQAPASASNTITSRSKDIELVRYLHHEIFTSHVTKRQGKYLFGVELSLRDNCDLEAKGILEIPF